MIKIGDLVKMDTHETGLIGVVVGRHPKPGRRHQRPQIGIMRMTVAPMDGSRLMVVHPMEGEVLSENK